MRSAYNVLHQYRQLAEKLIAFEQPEILSDVAEHMRYYAQTALHLHLGFVTETLAYDLAALCELAAHKHSPAHDAMLGCLLSIDQAPENEAQELTLRGVRKAQIKLATAYLDMHNELAAHRIYLDMQHERPERLLSIRDELLAVHSKGLLGDRRSRHQLRLPGAIAQREAQVFFGWFNNLDDIPATVKRTQDFEAQRRYREERAEAERAKWLLSRGDRWGHPPATGREDGRRTERGGLAAGN